MENHITDTHFIDLEIHISRQREEGYPVTITLSGEQVFTGSLAADIARRVPDIDPVVNGQRLFAALLADPPLRDAWNQALGKSPQRRIRLCLDADAPELHALPWELLWGDNTMLSANENTPFSRHLPVSKPWGGVVEERPIRVLAMISNPSDLDNYDLRALDVQEERALLEAAFAELDKSEIQLDVLDAPATLAQLETALHHGYHILHFVGHGIFTDEQQAVLYLQDTEGNTKAVSDEKLVGMLERQRVQPHLVFLAACQSAARSMADAFRGLGPKLVRAGVPAVVAMQESLAVATAQKLSQNFYQRLGEHGIVDCALNKSRSVLLTAGRPDAAVPVLFMRLKDGQLWRPNPSSLMERKPFEPETIYIPAGPFLMGSLAGEGVPDAETPQHKGALPAYRIGKYPVTNAQYAEFLRREKGQDAPRRAGWFNRNPPADRLDHPVTGVSWHDAVAYCVWLSKETGRHYRLPGEAEWEKAARGTDDRRYPWGDVWDDRCAHVGGTGTTAVGSHPAGSSPFGCQDMLGNVEEWTQTLWGNQWTLPEFGYPFDSHDGRELITTDDLPALGKVICRGGSYQSEVGAAYCALRGCADPHSRIAWRGFRVVMEG
ncbi:MAG: SUMF1/EgtB/PvdO family nonheme iron enzyme [Anaerolineae bacterium]|nr:SUMF1/EgtB/PvdO family nonheme iron enzyme [Anaerolineae bacterium]